MQELQYTLMFDICCLNQDLIDHTKKCKERQQKRQAESSREEFHGRVLPALKCLSQRKLDPNLFLLWVLRPKRGLRPFNFFLFSFLMAYSYTSQCSLEMISLNCQGLQSSVHRYILFSWLNCCKVGFRCLQETHSVLDTEFSSWLQSAEDDRLLGVDYSYLS